MTTKPQRLGFPAMALRLSLFLTLFFFCYSASSHAGWSGLLSVSSEYRDEATPDKAPVRVLGSGFLVRHGQRYFAFSAAHVASGKKPELKVPLNGETLQIKEAFASHAHDVVVFEVEKPEAQAPLLFDGKCFQVSFASADKLRSSRKRYVDRNNFFPLNHFVPDPNLEFDNRFSKSTVGKLFLDPLGVFLNADALIMPGSSGSPLFVDGRFHDSPRPDDFDYREELFACRSSSGIALRGIASKRERFFDHASFVPASTLRDLLNQVLEGKLERPFRRFSSTSWHLAHKVLFRRHGEISEAATTSMPTSGVLLADTGGGVSMYGGNNGLSNEDDPLEILEDMAPYPSSRGKNAPYWSFVAAGLPGGEPWYYSLWFELDYYLSVPSVGIIVIQDFHLGFAHARNKMGFLQTRQSHEEWYNTPRERKTRRGDRLRFHQGRYEILIQLDDEDTLEFRLSDEGILEGEQNAYSTFFPIHRLKSRQGKEYIVDLRELYFTEMAQFRGDDFRGPYPGSQQEGLAALKKAIEEQSLRVALKLRPVVERESERPIRLDEFQTRRVVFPSSP